MKYKLTYDCANVDFVGTDECIGFDTFSDAKDFTEKNKDFELRVAVYNCHQPNEGWKLLCTANAPIKVCESYYGDNYHLISSVEIAECYCREDITANRERSVNRRCYRSS